MPDEPVSVEEPVVLNVDQLNADAAEIGDLTAGDATFTGDVVFQNDIQGTLAGSRDINTVTASDSILDSNYVFISDGSHIKRILFSDLCDAILGKITYDSTKTYLTTQSINTAASNTNAILPGSDYLLISKGGTELNKITAANALSNGLNGLASQTSIESPDALVVIQDGVGKKVDYEVLAKAIVEDYAGSTIGGSQQSIQEAFSNVAENFTESVTSNITSDYGTLTYSCTRFNNFVGFSAQLEITSETPALVDLVKGLPSIGDAPNNTPVMIFSTADGYIPAELRKITLGGTEYTGVFIRTAIANGRSIRMNFVYQITQPSE